MLAALAGVDGLFSLVEVQPFERFDHTTILAPGEPRGGRMPDASACYPFATPSDFGVAAYANNRDGMGTICHLRVEFS